ncbi:MAG: hypothetical protein JXX14_18460, partial [Deltaproteobacteria bacterium]|nr:hypothetical protein [Deltaproteobacteria bacterium]
MEHLPKPEALSCDAVAKLYESSLDDSPLTRQQQDAIHHHTRHCQDCDRLFAIMHQFRDFADALDAEAFAPDIASLRNDWQTQRLSHKKKSPPIRLWAVSVAVAALFLVGFWQLWGALGTRGASDVFAFSVSCTPAAFLSPVDGVQITYCKESGAPRTVTRDGVVR